MRDFIILSFDTTGSQDSIAISVNGVVSVKILPQEGSSVQSSILVEELVEFLKSKGYELKDVDVLCVVRGPGSFTGIRLGLATAQGLQLATPCRIFAPSLFDLLLSVKPDAVAVVDSKRGDYFVSRGGSVSMGTLEEVSQLAQTQSLVSDAPIEGIPVTTLTGSKAEALISLYRHSDQRDQFTRLEPFYVRTPEFAKKKSVMVANGQGVNNGSA
jgi:tRNA threonylcarbamoyladenosine biosynthesis protein TsaB